MKIAKPLAYLLGALSVPLQTASGQTRLDLFFQDEKRFLITGPGQSEYLGGEWIVTVLDGVFLILPCFANDGLVYQVPTLGCANGTTALITQGDLDGDGLQDIGRYYSSDQPIPASRIEPFRADLIELFAAPPSPLPRPVDAFDWTDQSVVGFYDIIGDPLNGVGYEVAFYRSERPYRPDELDRHREEIVPGVYLFKFPALGSTEDSPADFFMSAAHREMVEAAPGPGGIDVGNDFQLIDDGRWTDGAMEFDPRLRFDFQWEGFNPSTFFGNDRLSFSVRDRETGEVRFPPVPPPQPPLFIPNPDTRQLIGSSELGIPSGIDIGANFFAPDEQLVVELEFRRSLQDGAATDFSGRFFRWNINLIDTYEGFLLTAFPLGTVSALRAPNFDYDGDGFTNLQEFGLQTDPADPASVPDPTPVLDPITGQCVLDIPKRPAIGSSLTYLIEYTFDLENWITITRDDPNWFIVFDNEDEISVFSRRPAGVNPCFLRVRFLQN